MKTKNYLLIAILFLLCFSYLFLEKTKVPIKDDLYDLKFEASSLTQEAFNLIKQEKINRNINIDMQFDINNTGLIGDEFTVITTTLGNIEAKRSATNPNISAIIVEMFSEIGLKKGDTIALNFSSSFPSVNVAVLCAMETLDLKGIIFSSVGASSYGANNPYFTYAEMENLLFRKNIISNKSCMFSIGGANDNGYEMDEKTKSEIVSRLEGLDYKYLSIKDLSENIYYRYKIYNSNNNIKCFINVGGNLVSFGNDSIMSYVGGGIITELPSKDKSIGLVQLFLKDSVPVINFLNIKDILTKYRVSIDPYPLPDIGIEDIYYRYKYNSFFAIIILIITSSLMIITSKFKS